MSLELSWSGALKSQLREESVCRSRDQLCRAGRDRFEERTQRNQSDAGKIRIQVGLGAIDTVGPKGIAKAFEVKETVASQQGLGCVAANGSNIANHKEKKVVGYPDDGEGVRSTK